MSRVPVGIARLFATRASASWQTMPHNGPSTTGPNGAGRTVPSCTCSPTLPYSTVYHVQTTVHHGTPTVRPRYTNGQTRSIRYTNGQTRSIRYTTDSHTVHHGQPYGTPRTVLGLPASDCPRCTLWLSSVYLLAVLGVPHGPQSDLWCTSWTSV